MTGSGARCRRGERRNARTKLRRTRAAIAGVIAALIGAAGCATSLATTSGGSDYVRAELDKGLALYRSRDFDLAAQRFQNASAEARRCRDQETERLARTAECTAWLRAGRTRTFAGCTQRLEELQIELGYSRPGVNTLIGLGAIARGERLPPFRLPSSVRLLLEETAAGGA